MASQKPKIAFLGLGAMGFGMATNLVKLSHPVTGFDVWAPTLQRFSAAGGTPSTTPRECVRDAPYVVFMVATAAQIMSALFEGEDAAVKELKQGASLMLCSTGPPEYVPLIQKKLKELGRGDVLVVDAPVSGGTIRAANGTLSIFAAGEEKALKAADPILKDMAGNNLWIIPGGHGAGTNVKMVHQVLAGIHIVMTSEAMGFVAKLGLPSKSAFEALKASEGSSWMFENRTPHMLVEDKTVYSALNIIVKDVGIVTAGGRSAHFPLFLSSAAEQVLASSVSAGLGLVDDANLVGLYLPQDPTAVLKLASSAESLSIEKLKLVEKAMAGVHLAAAAEAMCLGAKVGLDSKTMFAIISTAAGASKMFVEKAPMWLSGEWTSGKTIDDVVAELTEAIEEANKLKYPLNLAGTALQLFQLASLKGFGKDPDVAIARIWDGPKGPLFPRKSS
ncbi:related to 3-hydroxyisobutyrate dehydrogenase, mitochondrial precursor [Phialocephala subalpina]|uniref:Related to 3-hydroxyisobutyrate dehydrogenase, mitochondrial n=1 Tax=Phialocephala subalpina TaxID=576137 RepID=A0A1L7WZA9_9HELO|nr:related to 3-hydroxyisobutyrate dehydrogenase, mitochondrial precursor [Phialocephala subalpina]